MFNWAIYPTGDYGGAAPNPRYFAVRAHSWGCLGIG